MSTKSDERAVGAAAGTYGSVVAHAGGRELRSLITRAGSAEVSTALYRCAPYDLAVPALAVPRLSINLATSPVRGAVGGGRPYEGVARRYSVFVTPAHAPAAWSKSAPTEHVNLYFAPDALDGAESVWRTPRHNLRVSGTAPLIDRLERELRQPDEFVAEAVDSLARLLLVSLARPEGSRRAQVLSAAQLSRLADFVEAKLHVGIGVRDLAGVLDLPTGTFARAFLRTCGCAPYRFVLERRIARALALLAENRLTTREIAARCGFASPQHLARSLRQRAGMTPTEARHASNSSTAPAE